MTATPATDSAESILKALAASGTALSKRAAAMITKQGAALYEGNQHLKAAQDKIDELAMKVTRTSLTVEGTLPPAPGDVPPPITLLDAYNGMVERANCAAIAMQPAPGWLSDRQYDAMTKPEYGEAIRINVSQRILAQPAPLPGAKV
jgi:hypothetical protein